MLSWLMPPYVIVTVNTATLLQVTLRTHCGFASPAYDGRKNREGTNRKKRAPATEHCHFHTLCCPAPWVSPTPQTILAALDAPAPLSMWSCTQTHVLFFVHYLNGNKKSTINWNGKTEQQTAKPIQAHPSDQLCLDARWRFSRRRKASWSQLQCPPRSIFSQKPIFTFSAALYFSPKNSCFGLSSAQNRGHKYVHVHITRVMVPQRSPRPSTSGLLIPKDHLATVIEYSCYNRIYNLICHNCYTKEAHYAAFSRILCNASCRSSATRKRKYTALVKQRTLKATNIN